VIGKLFRTSKISAREHFLQRYRSPSGECTFVGIGLDSLNGEARSSFGVWRAILLLFFKMTMRDETRETASWIVSSMDESFIRSMYYYVCSSMGLT